MSTVAPTGDGTQPATPNNNGGTLINAGAVLAGDPINNPITIADNAGDGVHNYESQVIARDGNVNSTTDAAGVQAASPAGTLAFYPKPSEDRRGEFIIRGYTSKLNGVDNDAMLSPGSDYDGNRRSGTQPIVSTQKLGINPEFDLYAKSSPERTPNFTKGTGAGDDVTYVAPTGSGDTALVPADVRPTRAVPGELTYRFGGSAPTTSVYAARDAHSNE